MLNYFRMKALICVLYNKGKKNELTDDCRVRIKAGLKLKNKNSLLCFVGAEIEVMKKYCLDIKPIELNKCSSTFGNIREIYKYTKNKNFKEIIIISNNYHLKRIEFILRNYNLNWKIKSAEKILKIKLFLKLKLRI